MYVNAGLQSGSKLVYYNFKCDIGYEILQIRFVKKWNVVREAA